MDSILGRINNSRLPLERSHLISLTPPPIVIDTLGNQMLEHHNTTGGLVVITLAEGLGHRGFESPGGRYVISV